MSSASSSSKHFEALTDDEPDLVENLRVRRLRRYVSYSCKTASSESESDIPTKKSAAAAGKVKESFAIVKKSKDPYEDFKRSMLEMILEKQMFEASDLEQLLQCFLSLNSKQYHACSSFLGDMD